MAQQVNDIKAYVTAMRADPRCNGKIGVVGGSSGASHAVTVALDTTDSGVGVWPYWNAAARPDCAVMLSCIYDFSDWTPPTDHAATDPDFVLFGLENYAQTRVLNTLATLPLNPVTLVASAKAAGWRPLYMINSYGDHPTAYHQIVTMSCTLAANGLVLDTDYQRLTIPGTQHSFHYWNSWDHVHSDHSITVGRDVVAFLDAHPK